MGQTSSTSQPEDFAQLQGKLLHQLNIIKSVATVSHPELLHCIEELNSVTRSFTDRGGKQLRFLIKRGSDTTVFWKGTIRLRCLKINTNTNVIESTRLLTLRQFVVIYKEIIERLSSLSTSPQPESTLPVPEIFTCLKREELTASAFFPSSSKSESEEDSENECCVCMDRRACIMLSCCHEFCETCIDNWTRDGQHSNCPLCRSMVTGADDTWVLTSKSDPGDYASEVKGYLVGIADRGDEDAS